MTIVQAQHNSLHEHVVTSHFTRAISYVYYVREVSDLSKH